MDFMLYGRIAIKLVVGFLCLLLYLNISGRAQLAPNSAADQIGNYVLGGIIGGVIYNPDIHIPEMVIVIFMWGALILFTRILKNNNRAAKKLIDGRSLVLFEKGNMHTDNLRIAGKSARDFISGMHIHGIHRLEELETVWLETNGQYTILKKGETPFAISLVEDGQIVSESLTKLGKDEAWLRKTLAEQGADDPSKVAYAEWYTADGQREPAVHVYGVAA